MDDSFFLVPKILTVVSFSIFFGCICLCICFAKKQGRFPTVNRNGPAFGANRSVFGSGAAHNTPAYNEMINDNPPFGFVDNNFLTTQNNPPIGSTGGDTTVNTYGWTTTHNIVDDLPPSYSEATAMSAESRHQSHIGCDIGFRSHVVKGDSGVDGTKCDSGDVNKDGGTCESGDGGGTTYDSGGSGDSGCACDSGGDTGGGDSGGGDTTTE